MKSQNNDAFTEPQNKTNSEANLGSRETFGNRVGRKTGKIAAIAAISETEQQNRLAIAKTEVVRALDAMDASEQETDKAGWAALKAMVRLAETFETEDDVRKFYERQTNKQAHGNTKNLYQLVSKVCFPLETRSDRVTRFGQALAAMVGQGITSDRVMEELAVSKPIIEPAPKTAKSYGGINRFVLLFKQEERLKSRGEAPEAGPDDLAKDQTALMENPYRDMAEDELRAQALQIIQAIKARKIISLNLLKVEAALRSAP